MSFAWKSWFLVLSSMEAYPNVPQIKHVAYPIPVPVPHTDTIRVPANIA